MTTRRPGCGTSGEAYNVKANHFRVVVANESFYLYLVSIRPKTKSNTMCRQIIEKLVLQYKASHLNNRTPAYDGKDRLYTAGPLPFNFKEFNVILEDTNTNSNTNAESSSNRTEKGREFTVKIRYSREGDFGRVYEFLEKNQVKGAQEIIHALGVILRTNPSAEYKVVGRSFFSTTFGSGDLGKGIVYCGGYYQSLRASVNGFSLNIDLTAKAFYDAVDMINFIKRNLEFEVFPKRLDEDDCIKVNKALKGLRVAVTGVPVRRMYEITGLSSMPINEIKFKKQNEEFTVCSYFQQWDIDLQYPYLPAVQAGSHKNPIYLPMELCEIEKEQTYDKKLNQKQLRKLIKVTCIKPASRMQATENRMKQLFSKPPADNDLLGKNEFGISVKSTPLYFDARVLSAPTLLYNSLEGETKFAPRNGVWSLKPDKKLFDGGIVDAWACLSFSSNLEEYQAQYFCSQLISVCKSRGMEFQIEPVIPIRKYSPDEIKESLKYIHSKAPKQIQLLIIILPDRTGSYGIIKRVCETELGIVSQCCRRKTVTSRSLGYILENLVLKINAKVGGRNTILSEELEQEIPQLKVPTIIFGADVTHPQPGDYTSPSIAAVVASMDWPGMVKYRGLVSAQKHGQEIIQDFHHESPDGMIRKLLLSFQNSNKVKPERIIFYRDGVGDDQFSQVLLDEVDAIRKACASMWEDDLPTVTFIVVQKRHHTRFFGVHHQVKNIPPGTVVDTTVCHPFAFDFYLNSHVVTKKGTNCPIHYQVLVDENDFSADQLQSLTYSLCYTYARCTRSVPVVPPAHYAHLAAFRARYYIEGEEDPLACGGSAEVRALPAIEDTIKDLMFFC